MAEDTDQSQDSLTAVDYISSQLDLERQARNLMPYDPKSCTYTMGQTRQQVYACLTCLKAGGDKAGICYSCSIQCHADHDLVELFTKREFTCDCGTTRIGSHPCSLRSGTNDDIPASENKYNHNYEGKFCHCDVDYDPSEETGKMLQCLLGDTCGEDWFHDYCIMGLPKFKPEVKKEDVKLEGLNVLDALGEPGLDAAALKEDDEIAIDGFPNFDDFDCYICWKCVSKHQEFFDLIKNNDTIVADTLQRIVSTSIEDRNAKLKEQETFINPLKKRKIQHEYSIFLNPNHEANFKALYESSNDVTIVKFLDEFPYLIKDDPIYEPPADQDDDTSSIYDMGSRAINSLPREQAIDGVQAFDDIKTKLRDYLRPFADDQKVVKKEDIESFFAKLKESKESKK